MIKHFVQENFELNSIIGEFILGNKGIIKENNDIMIFHSSEQNPKHGVIDDIDNFAEFIVENNEKNVYRSFYRAEDKSFYVVYVLCKDDNPVDIVKSYM